MKEDGVVTFGGYGLPTDGVNGGEKGWIILTGLWVCWGWEDQKDSF